MTEQELIDLRDSLVTMNNGLDALDSRVTALEALSVPKGTYFESIKAAFENSPECCNCATEVPTCDCTNATTSTYLKADQDGVVDANVVITINGIEYTATSGNNIFDAIPTELVNFEFNVRGYVYLESDNSFVYTFYGIKMTNVSTENLCVSIKVVPNTLGNVPHALTNLEVPIDDGDGNNIIVETAFPFGTGETFNLTLNPTVTSDVTVSEEYITSFCLAAA